MTCPASRRIGSLLQWMRLTFDAPAALAVLFRAGTCRRSSATHPHPPLNCGCRAAMASACAEPPGRVCWTLAGHVSAGRAAADHLVADGVPAGCPVARLRRAGVRSGRSGGPGVRPAGDRADHRAGQQAGTRWLPCWLPAPLWREEGLPMTFEINRECSRQASAAADRSLGLAVRLAWRRVVLCAARQLAAAAGNSFRRGS
jgi:hypothetical protein